MQCMPRIIHLGLYSRGIREAAAANREAQRPKAIAHGANSIAAPFVCSHRHGCWTRRWCMNRPCGVGSPLLSDLHPLPIEKESGGPSAAIRFRMLQAIRASLRCDSG